MYNSWNALNKSKDSTVHSSSRNSSLSLHRRWSSSSSSSGTAPASFSRKPLGWDRLRILEQFQGAWEKGRDDSRGCRWLVAAGVLALMASYPLILKPAYQVTSAMFQKMRAKPGQPSIRV